jgi:hypothetical protein
MAQINKEGNIIAHCPGCDGGKSTFEYKFNGSPLGVVTRREKNPYEFYRKLDVQFRLFRCAGCGMGGIGAIRMMDVHAQYPDKIWQLLWFYPEAKRRLSLPKDVPAPIKTEFREAEKCAESGCFRASAAMFRSVLEKVFRANGYKTNQEKNLKQQIDAAATDGILTASRQRRAHDDIRVLGNDVLHEEWREIKEEDVEQAHHYTQRILEDFYDDRKSVLKLLREAGRKAIEDIEVESGL